MNSINFQDQKGVNIIHPVGEMTFFFLEELDAYLKDKVNENQFKFCFDMSDVKWIDSMGLGLIAMTVKIALLNNTRVSVVNPRDNIVELLRLSSLLDLILIHKNIDDAIAFFNS